MVESRPKRVLMVYPFLMHYRRGVFSELDRLPDLDVVFAAAPEGFGGVAHMRPSDLKRFLPTRVHRVRGVQWQRGVMTQAVAGDFDAVIFLGDCASLSTWAGAAILRIRRIPVLFWTIGWHRPERGLRRLARLAFYRLANGLLLYGTLGKAIGVQMGYPESRMHVIWNSVEASTGETSTNIPEAIRHLRERKVVGAVIRLNSTKRLDLLIDAVALLNERGLPVVVLLVGEGPARAELVDAARNRGVELIAPGPAYSQLDLDEIYSILDLTVVPSAVGLTAIQSLAHGVPVISDNNPYTQMPEWESIRPGITGGIYPPGDAQALADEIAHWLDRLDGEAEAVAGECRQEVESRWTAAAQAARIREIVHVVG